MLLTRPVGQLRAAAQERAGRGVCEMVRSAQSMLTAVIAAMAFIAVPAAAQVSSIDPDLAIDGDLAGESTALPVEAPAATSGAQTSAGNGTPVVTTAPQAGGVDSWSATDIGAEPGVTAQPATVEATTYRKDDLIGAAEGVFGKGSQGLASMIEDVLRKQGEPNGYITGREASGAIAFGLRYGSGTLHHKVEGDRSVYWTGPSLGLDLGMNAANAFVLVYNLFDSQELYHRYGSGEGQAYLVGGFHVSYLRRGDVVLIPVRMGAGLRLGANVGYMKSWS